MAHTLIVAGSGIKSAGHLTADTIFWIKQANKVLHLLADVVTERTILELNSNSESLRSLYALDRRRRATYTAMVERILDELAKNPLVCAVFYGHPGVFVSPSHEVIQQARNAGHTAMMLPGISAEDCLIADLGVDPAKQGLQTFEATDLLVYRRHLDNSVPAVIWQIGAVGNLGIPKPEAARRGLVVLSEVLISIYGAEHEVIVYEAAVLPTCAPLIHRVSLQNLAEAPISAISTLFVPPLHRAKPDPARIAALGLSLDDFAPSRTS